MADNAAITQSQECDYRHCRMQEVNSLCTDSGPLRAEYCIVGIPQYSHLVMAMSSSSICIMYLSDVYNNSVKQCWFIL